MQCDTDQCTRHHGTFLRELYVSVRTPHRFLGVLNPYAARFLGGSRGSQHVGLVVWRHACKATWELTLVTSCRVAICLACSGGALAVVPAPLLLEWAGLVSRTHPSFSKYDNSCGGGLLAEERGDFRGACTCQLPGACARSRRTR